MEPGGAMRLRVDHTISFDSSFIVYTFSSDYPSDFLPYFYYDTLTSTNPPFLDSHVTGTSPCS